MPEARSLGARAALVTLFAAALMAFTDSQQLRAAWLLLVPALLSTVVELPAGPARLRAGVERAFRALLLLALALGLAWTLYPVLPQAIFDAGPRLLGVALAAFAALFLLGEKSIPAPRGAIPACLGLIALGMLAPAGRPPLAAAALATAALAVHATLAAPTLLPLGVAPGTLGRLARTGAVLLGAGLLAAGIVRFLPWAQPFVERASAGWIDAGIAAPRSAVGSDAASLGELEKVALSKRVMMRVVSTRPQKLRVRVLTRFDGRTWHAAKGSARPLAAVEAAPELLPWTRDIPGQLFVLPGAESHEAVGAIPSRIVLSQLDAGGLAAPRGTRLVRLAGTTGGDTNGLLAAPQPPVEIYGVLNRRDLRDLALPDRAPLLALPDDTDPRLGALAARLAEGAPPRLRLQRTLNHLDRECRYALDVGAFKGPQPVAEFLFEKKRGYCEYFASAAAVLLRLQGIPTRYVTGWNVTEESAAFGHFVVRESDAHAWIEAYLDDEGWIEVDPTPAAQYAEVHGSEAGGWRGLVEAVVAATRELWIRVRAGDLGSLASWTARRAWPALAITGLALFVGLWRRRKRSSAGRGAAQADSLAPDVRALVSSLDAVFARHGHPRPPSRGLIEHERALEENALSPELREVVRQAAECVYSRAFGGAPEDAIRLAALRQRLSA